MDLLLRYQTGGGDEASDSSEFLKCYYKSIVKLIVNFTLINNENEN